MSNHFAASRQGHFLVSWMGYPAPLSLNGREFTTARCEDHLVRGLLWVVHKAVSANWRWVHVEEPNQSCLEDGLSQFVWRQSVSLDDNASPQNPV